MVVGGRHVTNETSPVAVGIWNFFLTSG